MSDLNVKSRTLMLAKMALMTAVSVICSFIHFPILPAAAFLEFEVSDNPIIFYDDSVEGAFGMHKKSASAGFVLVDDSWYDPIRNILK